MMSLIPYLVGKSKVAIAGVLALQPSILILDEATSMLDPVPLYSTCANVISSF